LLAFEPLVLVFKVEAADHHAVGVVAILDDTHVDADLVEAFVSVAVERAGGFAWFRKTATKTNSLVDRLEAITLPDSDDLIDKIVYDLYGLTEEEIEIVEEAVNE